MSISLSILDDDGGLGNAADYDPSGQLLRDVIVQIDGSYQTTLPFGEPEHNADGIAEVLNSKGWLAESVSNVSTAWFPGLSHFSYRVYAVVGRQYSDSQIQNQIIRDLSGYFNVSGVSFLTAPYNGFTRAAGSQYQPPPNTGLPPSNSGLPPANYGSSTPPAANPNAPGSNSAWSTFTSALGISTPIAIVGGGLLLILLLKER